MLLPAGKFVGAARHQGLDSGDFGTFGNTVVVSRPRRSPMTLQTKGDFSLDRPIEQLDFGILKYHAHP